jgi:hypothetical protein
MFALVMTWIGIVLGTALLLLMALGPVIVELDSWLAQRKRDRRRAQARARKTAPKVVARPATM